MDENAINKFVDKIIDAIETRASKKTRASFNQAKVLRVDGDTVWIHIPGGAEETPCKKTISCKKDDTVYIRNGGGNPVIVGNETAPPTDDTKANKAQETAEKAAATAAAAEKEAGGTRQHFWYLNGDSGEAGAHVTEVPRETFMADPQGPNLFMRSGGIFLRMALQVLLGIVSTGMQIFEPTDGTHPTAQFLSSGTVIGKETGAHVVVTGDKVEFYLGSFLIGYIEPAGSYLEISSSGRNLGLTNLASSGQGNHCDVDMTLGHMDFTATQDFKFNSNKLFNTFTATGTVSLTSGHGGAVTCSGTVPAGYTPIAIQAVESDHQQGCLIGRFKLTSTGAGITLRNVSDSDYSNMTVTATILCVNSSLL